MKEKKLIIAMLIMPNITIEIKVKSTNFMFKKTNTKIILFMITAFTYNFTIINVYQTFLTLYTNKVKIEKCKSLDFVQILLINLTERNAMQTS